MDGFKLPGWAVPLGLVAVLTLFVIVQFAGAQATGVRAESQITTTYRNNQNVLSSYTTRIGEMAQVPAMARNDIIAVSKAAMEGRYGENGSTAAFQAISERYPGQIDPMLYRRIQSAVEAGRLEFRDDQSLLLDQKRAYSNQLGFFWSGMWLHAAGYPKIDLSKYDVIVSTSAQHQFQTGTEEQIQLVQPTP